MRLKIQRTNEAFKMNEPLKALGFKHFLNVYEEITLMYVRPLVNELCMNMVIKMSSRNWSTVRSPLMKKQDD